MMTISKHSSSKFSFWFSHKEIKFGIGMFYLKSS
jgi:hypothetical protein